MFRSLPGTTVLYPSDAVSTERAIKLAANTKGITFIRMACPTTKGIYDNDEVFEVINVAR
jgi:transketolase